MAGSAPEPSDFLACAAAPPCLQMKLLMATNTICKRRYSVAIALSRDRTLSRSRSFSALCEQRLRSKAVLGTLDLMPYRAIQRPWVSLFFPEGWAQVLLPGSGVSGAPERLERCERGARERCHCGLVLKTREVAALCDGVAVDSLELPPFLGDAQLSHCPSAFSRLHGQIVPSLPCPVLRGGNPELLPARCRMCACS
jgi:hypothetical protein